MRTVKQTASVQVYEQLHTLNSDQSGSPVDHNGKKIESEYYHDPNTGKYFKVSTGVEVSKNETTQSKYYYENGTYYKHSDTGDGARTGDKQVTKIEALSEKLYVYDAFKDTYYRLPDNKVVNETEAKAENATIILTM